MMSLLLAAALAQAPANPPPSAPTEEHCAIAHFRNLVGPFGPPRSWRATIDYPKELLSSPGFRISDSGVVSDGYMHWLYLDEAAGRAYVSSIGGLTGHRRIYGPFPIPACSTDATSRRQA